MQTLDPSESPARLSSNRARGKHAGKNSLKVSSIPYLAKALYILFASYSIGNKWYTRVQARMGCFAEIRLEA